MQRRIGILLPLDCRNMLLNRKNMSADSDRQNQFDGARAFCEMIPGAVSLWSLDRSFCLLNESARRLINYSEADFLNRPSLWVERIHPDDRQKFCRSLEELINGKSVARCDYRFFARNANQPIWIRDHSVLRQGQKRPAWEIISAYTDISDLKSTHSAEIKKDDIGDIATFLSHEFRNCIHKIAMELELSQMALKSKYNSTEFVSAMEAINHLLENLREQVVRVVEGRTSQDPLAILDDIVPKMRNELNRQRVNLRLVRRGPLPMVEGDEDQLRSAFEQVFEFCGAMLKHGGNLEVEAGPKEVGGEVYAEVKLTSSSSASIELGGLGVVLAGEILARYRGRVSFQKESKNRGQVTVLIKASQN